MQMMAMDIMDSPCKSPAGHGGQTVEWSRYVPSGRTNTGMTFVLISGKCVANLACTQMPIEGWRLRGFRRTHLHALGMIRGPHILEGCNILLQEFLWPRTLCDRKWEICFSQLTIWCYQLTQPLLDWLRPSFSEPADCIRRTSARFRVRPGEAPSSELEPKLV